MTTTMSRPRFLHPHALGLAIISLQLHDGDTMLEKGTGERVVRMRTERQKVVPLTRPRLTAVEVAVALATQDTSEIVVVRPRTAQMPAVA